MISQLFCNTDIPGFQEKQALRFEGIPKRQINTNYTQPVQVSSTGTMAEIVNYGRLRDFAVQSFGLTEDSEPIAEMRGMIHEVNDSNSLSGAMVVAECGQLLGVCAEYLPGVVESFGYGPQGGVARSRALYILQVFSSVLKTGDQL